MRLQNSHDDPVLVDRREGEMLLDRARRLAVPGTRRMLGITGSPGAGSSSSAMIATTRRRADLIVAGSQKTGAACPGQPMAMPAR